MSWMLAAPPLSALLLLLALLPATGYELELPIAIPHVDYYLSITWRTEYQTAEECVAELRSAIAEVYNNTGLSHLRLSGVTLQMPASGDVDIGIVGGTRVRIPPAASGEVHFVSWMALPSTMHNLLGGFRADWGLDAEEWPYRAGAAAVRSAFGDGPSVGMFLLQSPGRGAWMYLAWALRVLWVNGVSVAPTWLHVLVHDVPDWRPDDWRQLLGPAFPMFGGLHWNRYPKLNPDLAGKRPFDNYFNKVFTIVALARRHGYRWIISVDDDIYMPPNTLAHLLNGGEPARNEGCGVLSPLLQNGVPSVEIFADTWLQPHERAELLRCLAESSANFCDVFQSSYCQPEQQPSRDVHRMLENLSVPDPWDPEYWYRQVGNLQGVRGKHGLHPIRGNATCMEMALDMALKKVWHGWTMNNHQAVLVDTGGGFPYLCNNVFLIEADLYADVITGRDIRSGGADEVALNRVLHRRGLHICLLSHSFAIHPSYSTNPRKAVMTAAAEDLIGQATQRILPWSMPFLPGDL